MTHTCVTNESNNRFIDEEPNQGHSHKIGGLAMKSTRILYTFLPLAALVLSSLACNLPGSDPVDPDAAVQATINAVETKRALQEGEEEPAPGPVVDDPTQVPTQEPTVEEPSPTPLPTFTPLPTATEIPCDRAAFVTDVTVPDGADYSPGDVFTKTWRLKNTGSCTWTSGYDLVFDHGDQMGAPAAAQLTSGTVGPNQTLDVSVQLTAPGSEGGYKGYFKLRNPQGVIFGIGATGSVAFWVEIEVLTALADPDLVITAIDFDPYPPTKNDSVVVRVKIKNQGGTTEEAFTVKWWPGENYPNPANSWNVNGGLDAGVTVTLTYVYAGYPSTYSGIPTKAVIDTGDAVGESNEGNNTFLRNIDVDP